MFDLDMDASQLADFTVQAADVLGQELEAGLAEAMAEAADRARAANFKDGSGDLRRSIRGDIQGKFTDGTLEGFCLADAEHALFVEVDTKAHIIAAKGVVVGTNANGRSVGTNGKIISKRDQKSAGRLAFEGNDGAMHFPRKVHHPGTKGTHFIGASMTEEEVNARMDDRTQAAIDKVTGSGSGS